MKFFGEEAEDAGGVTKEFFMLLLREILDPKYGMFKEYEETRAIWFSEHTFEDEVYYFLIGKLYKYFHFEASTWKVVECEILPFWLSLVIENSSCVLPT